MADYCFEDSSNNTSTVQQQDSLGNCSVDGSSLRVLLAVFYSLFFLLGLAGNVLALWVFIRLQSKMNSVRIFLINLAVADLLLMICLPFRIAYHANKNCWVLKPIICTLVGNIFYMNMYISIFLLGLISIDRYLKLQRISRRQKFLGSRQSMITCCLIWALAIAGIVPLIALSYNNNNNNNNTPANKCFQYKHLKSSKWKGYFNLFIVVLFWLVYVALVLSYGKIATGLLRVSREKPDLPNAARYGRTARKSFFVLFLFTLCFVPYHCVRIFYIHSQLTDVSCQWRDVLDKANEIALLLSAFNSCLDPVMYFVLCGSVRRVVLQVLCKFLCPKASGSTSSSSNDTRRDQVDHLSESEISTLRRKIATHINPLET
ncbi:probable G-protein coupled receptor 34 [Salminus brasiliensis]|uniref:probable G-protein coupled receptor 34 n=1 Tax=Salminus brasiliensis TaxID=930266 RepID=UPI003B82DEE8